MTTAMPETSSDANAMLSTMKARHSDLTRLLDDGAVKRRDLALAAQLGGDAQALREHDKVTAAAEAERIDLDSAIAAMTAHAKTLIDRENADADAAAEQARIAAIDELLDLDDKIDDGLDAVRELLERRDVLILANAKALHRAVNGDRIARVVMTYLDRLLGRYNPSRTGYHELERFAALDGYYFARKSKRMAEREPRPPSLIERILKQNFAGARSNATFGIDSGLENEKFHATRASEAAE